MPRFSTGEGPGVITPDGCSVDVYALLPVGREPEIIHAAVPESASILELGCGVGRVTRSLIALGHSVTAVDESPEMLAHVRGATAVCCRIEDLELHKRFTAVVLASHLVNVPDDEVLAAFLRCCARHVAADGCVVVERHPTAWFDTAKSMVVVHDDVTLQLCDVSRPAAELLAATVKYRVGEHQWSQSFIARRLDDSRLNERLLEAGLRLDSWLTEDGGWVLARPA